jgi:NAD(P)-dependent dehydrogenase (short-subunit alcohol dehydrogenase family)
VAYVLYYKRKTFPKGTWNGYTDLTNKVYIVTGANVGIGYNTAKKLASMNATVVLACRDEAKAKKAISEIKEATGNKNLIFIPLNLADLKEVNTFVDRFKNMGLPLHGLINNAGLGFASLSYTSNGFEMAYGVNHLGHFALTLQLLDKLKESHGKVVTVSSALHKRAKNSELFDPKFENVAFSKSYNVSKLANIHFAFELQRKLDEHGIPVKSYCVHPGIVATELSRNSNPRARFIFKKIIVPLLGTTADRAAEALLYPILSPDTENKAGKYFGYCIEESASPETNDVATAKKLWDLSEKLTGVYFKA